ncbi:two-component system response regulator [Halobacteriovorax sp.]|uniref:response regulator n=1 Tax=Halobacteriovorax sp. TaxID=2020862 RepID=UPI0035662A3A
MFILQYPIKIVLVDDDPESLTLMNRFLENNDKFDIYSFTSPKEALEFMKENETQIAVVDINMKEMYGDRLLSNIIDLESGTEVIIITASDNLINFTACYKLRANGFMFKPLEKKSFNAIVENSHKNLINWNNVFSEMIMRKHSA